jgi:hypothetical protein
VAGVSTQMDNDRSWTAAGALDLLTEGP